MRLLYGTSNPAKLQHMKEMLEGLDIEIVGLNEIKVNLEIDESGNNPLENARIKAMAYYKAIGIPSFSCDSGLFIEGLDEKEQPGVHVRRINNRYLNDEEFIEHYKDIIYKMDKKPIGKFKNAICLVLDENNIFEHDGDDISDIFLMTSKVHPKRREGFPMDSISIDLNTEKYIVEIGSESVNEEKITKGFRKFFIEVEKHIK